MSDSIYDIEAIKNHIFNEIDAAYLIKMKENMYYSLKSDAMFSELFGSSGDYSEMVKKLLFHLSKNGKNVSEEYQVFTRIFGKLRGKLRRSVNVFYNGKSIPVYMSSYQLKDSNEYVVILDRIDENDNLLEQYTREKEESIKDTYLFTMLVDLTNDLCYSVNVTELSEKPVYAQDLRYSQWAKMIVNTIHPDDYATFVKYTDPDFIMKNLNQGRCMSFDCQMKNLEDKYIWVKLIFNKVETLHDERFRFVFMVQDIHESSIRLIEDLKRYEELSNIDSLTGIYNHGKIENELYRYLDMKKIQNLPCSLIMIDIDYFKKVNDTFGHSVGDYVLKTMVSVSCEQLKKSNIILGRWGGEEFIGIAYGSNISQTYEAAEKLRIHIENYNFSKPEHITCSIGVIEVTENENADSAFERLDQALYTAKSQGRNRVICK